MKITQHSQREKERNRNEKPALVRYGSLFELTQAGSGTCSDNFNQNQHHASPNHPICVTR